MKTEIEAKIKIDNLQQAVGRLEQAAAQFGHEVTERDLYFRDDSGVVIKKGCGLRLRVQTAGSEQKFIITFKGPQQESKFKVREEIELTVNDWQAARQLLAQMGCTEALAFEKKRKIFYMNGCSISMDHLPLLGDFMEVEGPGESAIETVLARLGLADAKHICKGYATLMKEKLDQLSIKDRQVFFDNTTGEL